MSNERLPQRFKYRYADGRSFFGVCTPLGFNIWSVDCKGGGFGSFESDPWEILGHIIGDVEHFEWIDNDNNWHPVKDES